MGNTCFQNINFAYSVALNTEWLTNAYLESITMQRDKSLQTPSRETKSLG